jgi:hypothetical protein
MIRLWRNSFLRIVSKIVSEIVSGFSGAYSVSVLAEVVSSPSTTFLPSDVAIALPRSIFTNLASLRLVRQRCTFVFFGFPSRYFQPSAWAISASDLPGVATISLSTPSASTLEKTPSKGLQIRARRFDSGRGLHSSHLKRPECGALQSGQALL